MTTKCIIFLGPAGAGKSCLCGTFGSWLKREKYGVKYVNLDAATNYIPYKADFDIRDFFTTQEIMKQEKIGPNGAILRANEKINEFFNVILESFVSWKTEFILIDTPGQLETFIFQPSGPTFLQNLQEHFDTVGIYLLDVETFGKKSRASELVVNLLLYTAVLLKININILPVLSKSDKISRERDLRKMLQDTLYLKQVIMENNDIGAIKGVVLPIIEHILEPFARVILTSSKTNDFSSLFSLIHENFCSCGDLS
ncbi:MAG: ATP/GTP-binding protein [Candidatus Helarchaeota archaeon]